MIDFPHIADVCQSTSSKVVMLVVDGLGGAATSRHGPLGAGGGQDAQPGRAGVAQRLRTHAPGAAGHHAWKRTRATCRSSATTRSSTR